MSTDHGESRDRSVKYGELVRGFDEKATADEMRLCAGSKRYQYRYVAHGPERARAIAEAAYCDSVADCKAEGARLWRQAQRYRQGVWDAQPIQARAREIADKERRREGNNR